MDPAGGFKFDYSPYLDVAKLPKLHVYTFLRLLPIRYFTCHGKELNTLALSNTYGGSTSCEFYKVDSGQAGTCLRRADAAKTGNPGCCGSG